MRDAITVRGISATGRHGVFAEERVAGQPFSADVTVWADTRLAARSDELAATVDYGLVATIVHARLAGDPVNLVETLAADIAAAVLDLPGADTVEVTVHKPHAPIPVPFDDVAVTVRRHRRRAPRSAVIALGSNLGDPVAALRFAAAALASTPGITHVEASGLYRTAPVGGVEQPDFLNAVLRVTTDLPALDLLRRGLDIEAVAGRVREVRWGPRTLDVDLIAVDGETSATPELSLPHPRAHERGFVLIPWADVDPDATLDGRRVADLARAAGEGVVRLTERLGVPGVREADHG